MDENIQRVKEFINKTAIYYADMPSALSNILNELERLQKDNYKLARENQLLLETDQELLNKNQNITRELISRTNKLSELLVENRELKKEKINITKELLARTNKLRNDSIPKQAIKELIEKHKTIVGYTYYDVYKALTKILGDE